MAAKTNPEAIGNFSGLLDALSAKIDNTDLQAIRKDYSDIITALRTKADTKPAKTKAATKKTEPAKAKQPAAGGCPNGQCPINGGYYNRWGW